MKKIFALIMAALALTLAACSAGPRSGGYGSHSNSAYRIAATVEEVRFEGASQRDSATGAVIGGVVGGIAGNQIGGGTGRTVATIAGAVGGALIGNEVAKNNAGRYVVTLRTDDGRYQTIETSEGNAVRRGDRVFYYPDRGQIERM